MLDDLGNEWVKFQECLIESDVMLKKYKEKFKTGLIHSSEEFKKTVHALVEDFQTNGINFKLSNRGGILLFCLKYIYSFFFRGWGGIIFLI